MTGKTTPKERLGKFHSYRFLFYTPHTLKNDLAKRQYSLKEAVLLIIDEAHHTCNKHPYKQIVDVYKQQNPKGSLLALTASPVASKERIAQLCSDLHVPFKNIHVRTREDGDVKPYLQKLDVYKVGVSLTALYDEIYLALKTVLEEKLEYLSSGTSLSRKNEKQLFREQVLRRDLLQLNNKLRRRVRTERTKEVFGGLSVMAQSLILCHMKAQFIRDFLGKGWIEQYRITDTSDSAESTFIQMLMMRANPQKGNPKYSPEEIWGHGLPAHEALLPRLVDEFDWAVVAEGPVFLKPAENQPDFNLLNGHIDFIAIVDGKIYICDYKPDQDGPDDTIPSKSFINSVPQISTYALLFKKQTGIPLENIKCLVFNDKNAWVYDPDSALKLVSKLMIENKDISKIPWYNYFPQYFI